MRVAFPVLFLLSYTQLTNIATAAATKELLVLNLCQMVYEIETHVGGLVGSCGFNSELLQIPMAFVESSSARINYFSVTPLHLDQATTSQTKPKQVEAKGASKRCGTSQSLIDTHIESPQARLKTKPHQRYAQTQDFKRVYSGRFGTKPVLDFDITSFPKKPSPNQPTSRSTKIWSESLDQRKL